MRRLKTELANKDAIISGFEADRVMYQGNNSVNLLTSCIRLICYTADNLSVADAINKAKEFTENIGSIDRLRNENIELNKLNETMKTELEATKKSLAQAEQSLETERQSNKDALRDVQDRLDKRLDESLAIDNQLLSKFLLKNSILLPLCFGQLVI